MKTNQLIRTSVFNSVIMTALVGMGTLSAKTENPLPGKDDRPYGTDPGSWVGGSVYYNIGDDVYIYSERADGSANIHGMYGNASTTITAGDDLKIELTGKDGDGFRANPGGYSNAKDSKVNFIVGDNLVVWVKGESGDAVNLNGFSTFTAGDNAKFYAHGTYRSGGEGSHGLRANMGSKISTGKNTYIETIADKSHGLYTATGLFSGNTNDASATLGDGAVIVTEGAGSHGVYAATSKGTVDFLGSLKVTTEGAGSHGVYGGGSKISVATNADILTKGDGSHGIYTSSTSTTVTLGTSATIDALGTGSSAIYTYSGTVTGAGKYTIGATSNNASIRTRSGTVNLEMNDSSLFNGFTQIDNASGKINIKMEDSSVWKLSQSSVLTNLDVQTASQIVYTIDAEDDYTFITASEALLDNAIMKVILNGYNPVLNDEFLLLSATLLTGDDVTFDFTQALLGFGLEWDTSTFLIDGTIRVIEGYVPEPATCAAIFGLSALGLVLLRRRNQALRLN